MKKIKIGLFGLGNTGKVVAHSLFHDKKFDLIFAVKNRVAKAKEFDFVVEPKELIDNLIRELKPHMVIDFTAPQAVMENIDKLNEGMGYVIATTGFTDSQLRKIKKYKNLRILYAPNISDGINVLIRACKLMNRIWGHADSEIIEQHFKGKKDAPSATAEKITNVLPGNTPVHSVRAGGITGVHQVIMATDNQKITLEHESFNREVFAKGAKRAALWLQDKDCGFYDIAEVYK
ncbi:4-hydroxy-tetrahydrodipicolinate reductase [Verrucomicrobiota bacterium]